MPKKYCINLRYEGHMNYTDLISLFTGVVTAVGVLVALIALFYQNKSLIKQFKLQNFSEYTGRYQEITKSFPENIN